MPYDDYKEGGEIKKEILFECESGNMDHVQTVDELSSRF